MYYNLLNSFLLLDIRVFYFCFLCFSSTLSFTMHALSKCLIIFVHSFMYEVIKNWLKDLCIWALLWGDWASHFLESPPLLVINTFFPLGLFSFSRGKFPSVLLTDSMPGYQVILITESTILSYTSTLMRFLIVILSPWTTFPQRTVTAFLIVALNIC